MNVLFRLECGFSVGMGHVMRCLALASAFAKRGARITFAASSLETFELAKKQGYSCLEIPSSMGFLPIEETDFLRRFCADTDLVIVDSYDATREYLCAMDAFAPTVYIDDVHRDRLDIFAVINGNLTADSAWYKRCYADADTLLLVGTKYCILRDEFSLTKPPELERGVCAVMVTTGGSDPHEASVVLTEKLLSIDVLIGSTIHVIAGPLNPNRASLNALAESNTRVIVHEDVDNMSAIMAQCQIAISAAGTTLNELCSCGVPTVAFSLVGNQKGCAQFFCDAGAALDAGDIEDEGFFSSLESQIRAIVAEPSMAVAISNRARSLFDGRGAARIVESLEYGLERNEG